MAGHDPGHDRVLACVRSHIADIPPAARVVPCRTGKFNSTFFIERDNGDDLVIRIAPPTSTNVLFYERNMMAQEPGLHRRILAETATPVPRIFAYDTTHEIIERDFLIMERMPGKPLTEAAPGSGDVKSVFRQVGAYLAQVHAIHARQYGYLGEHHCMEPQPDWRRAFGVMWNKLIDDTVGCGGYSARDADHMRGMLDRHEAVFDRKIPASLLHMDIWHQNVLVDSHAAVTGIIDWDRALWGDPEIEFAVLDYCGVSVPEFWQGYGRNRDQSPEAAIRNRFYLLYEVQKYILISICRRKSPSQAAQYRQTAFQLAGDLAPL